MTAGLLHNRTENSKCKQGFLCQGMEIGSQPVLSSLDPESGVYLGRGEGAVAFILLLFCFSPPCSQRQPLPYGAS